MAFNSAFKGLNITVWQCVQKCVLQLWTAMYVLWDTF